MTAREDHQARRRKLEDWCERVDDLLTPPIESTDTSTPSENLPTQLNP